MLRSRMFWFVFLTILLVPVLGVTGAFARGGPGGGGGGNGGGGGGGGGSEPPADPAIAYFDDGDLMVMNADGSNQTVVVAGAANSALHDCTWSPDGSRIAFRGDVQGAGIYVVNADGTGLDKIVTDDTSTLTYLQWSPAATPDGQEKIVFRGRFETQYTDIEIFVVNPDGSELQQLTDNAGRTETYPTWSPDGSRLAVHFIEFTNDADGFEVTGGGLEIYDLVGDGSGGIEIGDTTIVVEESGPDASAFAFSDLDWGRTGDVLAYFRGEDLWIIDLVDPESPINLTDTPDVRELRASWAPDDTALVFVRQGTGGQKKNSGLYAIDVSSLDLTNLGAKSGVDPDWLR